MKTPLLFFVVVFSFLSLPVFAEPNWIYTIRPGENIWTICKKYTDYPRCWLELADLNQVERTRRMKPGQQIQIPMHWLKNKPIAVTVSYVAGDAEAQRDARSRFHSLKVGERLPVGAVIRTGQGAATLLFADGSSLQLEDQTILALDTVSNFEGKNIVDSSLRLQRGAVRAKVQPQAARRFQIHTPAAVASVRGTEYRVSAEELDVPIARSEVFEGEIHFANSLAAQSVVEGFASSASETSAPIEPVKLLDAPTLSIPDRNVTLPYLFSWEPLDLSNGYQVSLFEDNNEEKVFRRAKVSSERYEINQLKLGCYGVKVAGVDDSKFVGKAANGRLCFVETVFAPLLPPEGFKHGSTVTWASVENAEAYLVQTSLDPSFSEVLSEQRVVSAMIDIQEKQQLYVRVASVGSEGQVSEFSELSVKQQKPKPWWLAAPAALLVLLAL